MQGVGKCSYVACKLLKNKDKRYICSRMFNSTKVQKYYS
jgi:hypothetical protein